MSRNIRSKTRNLEPCFVFKNHTITKKNSFLQPKVWGCSARVPVPTDSNLYVLKRAYAKYRKINKIASYSLRFGCWVVV